MNETNFLVSTCALAFLLSCVALVRQYLVQKKIVSTTKAAQKQLEMTCSSVVGMGNRILELERRLSSLRHDQQVLSDTQQDFSYSKAKNLIEQGIPLQAVATSTGLSASELELMKLIHAQSNAVVNSF